MMQTVIALSSLLLALLYGNFSNETAALAPTELTITFAKHAHLVDGGQEVELSLKVRCATGYTVLETLAYVTQNEHQSRFASLPIRCDNKLRHYSVSVFAASEHHFQAGSAQVSGYILLIDPRTGTTVSASPTRAIIIN